MTMNQSEKKKVSRRKMLKAAFVAGGAALVGLPGARRAAAQQTPQTITLKMQSTWPTKDIFHDIFVAWGKKVDEMSGGRLKIDILPSGAVVPAFQLIDAIHTGTLDGGHGVAAYWFGKSVTTSLFGTGPSIGLDAEAMIGWIHYGGGQELYNELIQKMLKLDVQSFFHGPMPTQPLGWFKTSVTNPNQFVGMKYRTVGLSADLFKAMGASVVILPGGEIVAALDRNLIDAAEFNNTTSDRMLGFPDVRKVMMAQSYHQPQEFLELLISKKKYESLPKDLQAIIKYAAMAESADFTWKMMDRNSVDLIEMKAKQGVKVVKTPKSVLEAQLKAWDKVIEEKSKDNPFFVKVLESQKQWAARVVPWRNEIMVDEEMAYNHFFKKPAAPAAKPAAKEAPAAPMKKP
jgi:TRAP-type mannitol/chloroaromatic compound transport system substrate-binding protein